MVRSLMTLGSCSCLWFCADDHLDCSHHFVEVKSLYSPMLLSICRSSSNHLRMGATSRSRTDGLGTQWLLGVRRALSLRRPPCETGTNPQSTSSPFPSSQKQTTRSGCPHLAKRRHDLRQCPVQFALCCRDYRSFSRCFGPSFHPRDAVFCLTTCRFSW